MKCPNCGSKISQGTPHKMIYKTAVTIIKYTRKHGVEKGRKKYGIEKIGFSTSYVF